MAAIRMLLFFFFHYLHCLLNFCVTQQILGFPFRSPRPHQAGPSFWPSPFILIAQSTFFFKLPLLLSSTLTMQQWPPFFFLYINLHKSSRITSQFPSRIWTCSLSQKPETSYQFIYLWFQINLLLRLMNKKGVKPPVLAFGTEQV